MHCTYFIFDREYPAKNILTLLGSVVANPRRPLDNYIPRNNDENTASLSSSELDVMMEKPAKIHAESIKTAEGRLNLQKVFGMSAGTDKDDVYDLWSPEINTYALKQHGNVFSIVKSNNESELRELLDKHGGTVYMMMSLKIALNPTLIRKQTNTMSMGSKVTIPVLEASNLSLGLGDPEISAGFKSLKEAALESLGCDELAFAAEYCEIKKRLGFVSLKKGVRRTLIKSDVVKHVSGRGLAFGDETVQESKSNENEGGGYV